MPTWPFPNPIPNPFYANVAFSSHTLTPRRAAAARSAWLRSTARRRPWARAFRYRVYTFTCTLTRPRLRPRLGLGLGLGLGLALTRPRLRPRARPRLGLGLGLGLAHAYAHAHARVHAHAHACSMRTHACQTSAKTLNLIITLFLHATRPRAHGPVPTGPHIYTIYISTGPHRRHTPNLN